jgi:hypothetical protein
LRSLAPSTGLAMTDKHAKFGRINRSALANLHLNITIFTLNAKCNSEWPILQTLAHFILLAFPTFSAV